MRNTILTIVMVALTLGMNAQEIVKDSVAIYNVDVTMPSINKLPKKQVIRVIDTERKNVVEVPKIFSSISTLCTSPFTNFFINS